MTTTIIERYAAGERDFTRADLRGADLRGAYLRGADLRGADLRGARRYPTDPALAGWACTDGVLVRVAS